MSVREIVKIWDENGIIKDNIDFLHKKTRPVKFPLSNECMAIIKDLEDSYEQIPCAGIAANQLGYNYSIFIGMKVCDDEDEGKQVERMESEAGKYSKMKNEFSSNREIYINPKIYKTKSDSTQEDTEGCLSVPNLTVEMLRYDKIKVRYRTVDGGVIKKPLKGFISKLFQHELDHLNGVVMLNLVSQIAEYSPLHTNPIKNKQLKSYLDDYYSYIGVK